MAAAVIAPFWLLSGEWGAQTATISLSLTFTPSAASGVSTTTRASGTLGIPCNFPLYFQGLQTVTTGSLQAMALGSVAPLGFCVLHNTDDVNYVSVYSNASGSSEMLRLYPGDWALLPLGPSATPYVEANTNSINLEIYLTAR